VSGLSHLNVTNDSRWVLHERIRSCAWHMCDTTHSRQRCDSSCVTQVWQDKILASQTTCSLWVYHGTRVNESCRSYTWVVSHTRLSHLTMCSLRMSHGTQTNESWHRYQWVMSHAQMSHVPHTHTDHKWIAIQLSHICKRCEWATVHKDIHFWV